jgi:hypothetical protein
MEQQLISLQARVASLEFLFERLLLAVLHRVPPEQREAILTDLYASRRNAAVQIEGADTDKARQTAERILSLTHHNIDEMVDRVVMLSKSVQT